MKRRLCSLILVFCLILGILPLNVLAAGTGFEYKISGTANYTITGDKGSVNGYSWISSNEVHVALTSDTPNDAQITLVEQDNVTTLVDGYGKYQWSTGDEFWGDLKNWVIAYKVDELPVLVQNQAASESIEILAKETYTVDLESVFTDADEDDIVSYQVKVNNGGYVNINGSNYSYTPDTAGTTKLTFRPYDGFVYGKKTFTVNITAIDSVATYDVSVNNLPEGAKFFSNNGFNADGTDIQGDELEAVYAAGVYTVKVPDNADCISIDVNGAKSTVRVSKETAIVNMQKITFVVETMAGDSAEGIVAVTYGEDRRAVGLGNVFYLPSGEGYTYSVTPSDEFSGEWSAVTLSDQTVTEDAEAVVTLALTVRRSKTITVDSDAEINVVYQKGYYLLTPVEPSLKNDNGDGTTTYTYSCPGDQGYAYGYMYFATKDDLISKAGYMMEGTDYTVSWDGETRTKEYRGAYSSDQGQGARGDDSVLVNVNSRNHLVLNVGETFRLRSFRIWEIINTDTENVMIEPKFTYTGYDKNMITLVSANEKLLAEKGRVCGTGGNNWMDMTVNSAGTTFLEVGYEAIHLVNGNSSGAWGGAGAALNDDFFNAIDPNRTALIVVQTDGKAAEDVKFGIHCLSSNVAGNYYEEDKSVEWDAEFDTFYFEGEKGTLTLSPTATSGIQSVAVSYDKGNSWSTLTGEEGIYSMDVLAGNNIIRVINGNGETAYQVVRGDKITYDVTLKNDADADGVVDPGDTVRVTFYGMHNPVGKMSGIYNPGYGQGQRITYTWGDGEIRQSEAYQYDFVSNAWIEVTVPTDAVGDWTLTDGYINLNVLGDAPGNHRNLTDDGRSINMTAESNKYTRCLLPEILIYDGEDILAGDMDSDGTISVTDVNMLINAYRGKTFVAAGDMDNDGDIDVTDVNILINAYRNKA